MQLTNTSDKVATAWVVKSRHFTKDGKQASSSSNVVVCSQDKTPGLLPGGVWQGQLNIPVEDGKVFNHDLELDYVLFSDQSAWGPDTGKMSLRIRGMIQARRAERARLKSILEQHGIDALIEDLKK